MSINWSRRIAALLSEDSDIPTDVTFKFVKLKGVQGEESPLFNDDDGAAEVSAKPNDDGEVSAHPNDDGEVFAHPNDDGEVSTQPSDDGEVSVQPNESGEEVSAHKMILALVSPVFRKMLYVHNTVDIFAEVIIMEDTTAPLFRIFIDAIYGVTPIQESLKGKTVDEIFAVLYLVHKYDIPELVLAIQDTVSSFPLTADTVLEVAGDVMDYSSTFQEEADQLLHTCAKFLKNKFTRSSDIFRLIAENGDRLEVIHKLAVLVRQIQELKRSSSVTSVPGLMESSEEESEDEDALPLPPLSGD